MYIYVLESRWLHSKPADTLTLITIYPLQTAGKQLAETGSGVYANILHNTFPSGSEPLLSLDIYYPSMRLLSDDRTIRQGAAIHKSGLASPVED